MNNTFSRTTLKETLTGRYDDEGWWCLAWLRAYELTSDDRYLERAERIFEDLATNAWDDACGGGVWWSYAKSYKNAITNELFFAMAAKLHKTSPDAVVLGKPYLSWANDAWTWFNASGMINAKHLVNDGLISSGPNPPCTNNGQTEWTYNSGVVLGGLAWLYEFGNGDERLLDAGVDIARATMDTLVWNASRPVLKESCDSPDANGCDLDQEQFKGIFVRYLMYFALVLEGDTMGSYEADVDDFKAWIDVNVDSIWGDDRSSAKLSELWVGPFGAGGAGAIMQSSATDALLAQAVLQA